MSEYQWQLQGYEVLLASWSRCARRIKDYSSASAHATASAIELMSEVSEADGMDNSPGASLLVDVMAEVVEQGGEFTSPGTHGGAFVSPGGQVISPAMAPTAKTDIKAKETSILFRLFMVSPIG